MKRLGLILAVLFLFAVAARADEFHLKDGSTVIGTIVGYQGNSFRVKTSYGFALVDRGAIVSITVSKPATSADARNKTRAPENRKPATPTSASIATNRTLAAAKHEPSAKPTRDAKLEDPKKSSPEKVSEPAAPPTAQSLKQTPVIVKPSVIAATPPTPATVPAPIPVREEVQGNLYINDTYGFRMYKPPDWNVINGARAALPGAVVAMGTSDQTTYLIIGLEPSSGTLQAHVTSTNERLSNMFENFRPLAARQTIVAGLRAYEYQFQGMANNQ
ncbi:MAG TPA: hypothetical protein VNF00_01350, partial [Candidatus Acidoferrales bacterium]|nr:hypothetical protein [Candidatus Acidoferrales bacterium]